MNLAVPGPLAKTLRQYEDFQRALSMVMSATPGVPVRIDGDAMRRALRKFDDRHESARNVIERAVADGRVILLNTPPTWWKDDQSTWHPVTVQTEAFGGYDAVTEKGSDPAPVAPTKSKKNKVKDFTPKPVGKVKPAVRQPRFIVVDLETTGLDHFNDAILEIAIAVTDIDLDVLEEHSWLISLAAAPPMEEWAPQARAMHEKNGLIQVCRDHGRMISEVETDVMEFLGKYTTKSGFAMTGSSVHFDRRMLMHQMPVVEAWFHYRNIDVSTLKVLVGLWKPKINAPFLRPEDKAHRGLQDIHATIEEMRHYRRVLGLQDDLPFMDKGPIF